MVRPHTLGVYADLVYARRDGRLVSNMAFAEYISALSERVERVVLFGRLAPNAAGCEHPVAERVEFVPLPYYASVADLPAVYRSLGAAGRAFSERLPGLDCVWLFGPHPVALRFARLARARGVRVALGVRQDQPAYMRSRLHGPKRLIGVPYFDWLERRWRRLARDLPTLTAGEQLARVYGDGANVMATAFTLVRESSIAARPVAHAVATAAAGPRAPLFRLLSVGRLDPEKNPLLLPQIVARLHERRPDVDWRLSVAGDGPLTGRIVAECERLGVGDRVELLGYVFGEDLRRLYGRSDLLLHVSHTEGLPQVLIEAMAAGVPIVATDVGGVAAAVAGTGVPLFAPDDARAAAAAVIDAADDPAARERQAEAGLRRARDLTIERQQEAALDHILAGVRPGAGGER